MGAERGSKSLLASDRALSEALGEGERIVFLWEMEPLVGQLIPYIAPGSMLTCTYTHMGQH